MAAPKGNKYAAKAKEWTDAIRRAIRQEYGVEWQEALREAATPLVKAARNGDLAALKEIGDRLEGRAHQTSEVTITQTTSLRDLSTDELANIALGRGEGASTEAGGEQEHSAVH